MKVRIYKLVLELVKTLLPMFVQLGLQIVVSVQVKKVTKFETTAQAA